LINILARIDAMAQVKVFEGNRAISGDARDALERLVAENFELRHTTVELVLQTTILRERLSNATTRKSLRQEH